MTLLEGPLPVRRIQSLLSSDHFIKADSATSLGSDESGKLWVPGYGLQGIYGSDGGHLFLGAVGVYASLPDSVALSVTGDAEFIGQVAPVDWTPNVFANAIITKWGAAGQRSYFFQLNTDGTLTLTWTANGTTQLAATSTVSVGLGDLVIKYVKATIDVNNGAAGRDIKFYTSDDGSSWTQLGSTVTQAGVTSIFDSTAQVEIGSQNSGVSFYMTGKLYRAKILNGLAGTVVLDVDFTKQPANTRSFTEDSSNGATVTITGGLWGITSNKAAPISSTAFSTAVIETRRSDVDVQANVASFVNGGGLVVREQDGANFISVSRTGTNKLLQKISNGVASTLLTIAETSTGVITIKCRGTSIIVLMNGSEIGRVTDPSFQFATKHGLLADANTTQRWVDFSVLAAA